MCIISDKIKFCTCAIASVDKLEHYWLLYRFNNKKDLLCVGDAIMPYQLMPYFQLNKQTLANRLNEPNAFDKPITFRAKDQLEIVINNLLDETKRMVFCFQYKNGKWIEEEYNPLELTSQYNPLVLGDFKQVEI